MELYYICIGILGLVVLFGQAKLFEIATTLKEIKVLIEKEASARERQSEEDRANVAAFKVEQP
jgi:hypothetical protein